MGALAYVEQIVSRYTHAASLSLGQPRRLTICRLELILLIDSAGAISVDQVRKCEDLALVLSQLKRRLHAMCGKCTKSFACQLAWSNAHVTARCNACPSIHVACQRQRSAEGSRRDWHRLTGSTSDGGMA